MFYKFCTTAAVVALATTAAPVSAATLVSFTEQASGVIVDYSGSVDTTGFTTLASTSSNSGSVRSGLGVVGQLNGAPADLLSVGIEWAPFGSAMVSTFTQVRSGDTFALASVGGASDAIWLDSSYVSGSALSGQLTFVGATFALLGLTDGTFVTNTLANGDSISFAIGDVNVSAVPLPAGGVLMLSGLAAFAGFKRRKKNRA